MLRRGDQGPQAGDKLQQTYLAQPAVFVIEYCLAQLLMSWGIVPKALMGYSLGSMWRRRWRGASRWKMRCRWWR